MAVKRVEFMNKRVGIKVDEPAKQSPGGITIVSPKEPTTGVIEYVAADAHQNFTKGGRVLFKQFAGRENEVEINGEKIRVLDEEDIIAVVS